MSIEVFGITGTNGKTTTSYMLKKILEEAKKKCGLIGTISHQIGEARYEAVNTTPSYTLLERFFLEMEEQETDCCVMEVSSHGIAQGRIADVHFSYAGFTNLTPEHLDYHKSMEEYYCVKAKLFHMAKKGVCINVDDSYGNRLYQELMQKKIQGTLSSDLDEMRITSYSIENPEATFYGKVLCNTIEGVTVQVFYQGKALGKMEIPIPGITSAYNGILAFGLSYMALGDEDVIFRGMSRLDQIPGRFQRLRDARGYNVIVDFAHTPDALETLLRGARALCCGKMLCVFGCGGDRDKFKRPMMGKVAGELCDLCIITSDNPRFEQPEVIIKDIEKGMKMTPCSYIIEVDRKKAIEKALGLCKEGDLLIIAGKGHEKYQLINGEKLPFDDEEVVMKSIKMRE